MYTTLLMHTTLLVYTTNAHYRQVVDVIDEQWVKLTGAKLSDVAFDDEVGASLNECINAQPVTFMLQVGPV